MRVVIRKTSLEIIDHIKRVKFLREKKKAWNRHVHLAIQSIVSISKWTIIIIIMIIIIIKRDICLDLMNRVEVLIGPNKLTLLTQRPTITASWTQFAQFSIDVKSEKIYSYPKNCKRKTYMKFASTSVTNVHTNSPLLLYTSCEGEGILWCDC